MGDLFEDDKKSEEETKVKVGEKEYSQEELNSLVNLGETAKEYETKWNRKISEFYPDYTQKSQKLSDYEKKEAERARIADEQLKREQVEKEKEFQERAKNNELTPEETRELIIKQAKEYGLVTKDGFDQAVDERVARYRRGEELLN